VTDNGAAPSLGASNSTTWIVAPGTRRVARSSTCPARMPRAFPTPLRAEARVSAELSGEVGGGAGSLVEGDPMKGCAEPVEDAVSFFPLLGKLQPLEKVKQMAKKVKPSRSRTAWTSSRDNDGMRHGPGDVCPNLGPVEQPIQGYRPFVPDRRYRKPCKYSRCCSWGQDDLNLVAWPNDPRARHHPPHRQGRLGLVRSPNLRYSLGREGGLCHP
jgi:hypothetical protein